MTMQKPISPELQAKIDALPDENLRANISRRLNRPWKRTKSNEQIFEEMLANYEEVMAERAKWRVWRDDEVLAGGFTCEAQRRDARGTPRWANSSLAASWGER